MKKLKKGIKKAVALVLAITMSLTVISSSVLAESFSSRPTAGTIGNLSATNSFGADDECAALNAMIRIFPATKKSVETYEGEDSFDRYKYQALSLYFFVDEVDRLNAQEYEYKGVTYKYDTTSTKGTKGLRINQGSKFTYVLSVNGKYATGPNDISDEDVNRNTGSDAGGFSITDIEPNLISYENAGRVEKLQDNLFLDFIRDSIGVTTKGRLVDIFSDPVALYFQETFDNMLQIVHNTDGNTVFNEQLRTNMINDYVNVLTTVFDSPVICGKTVASIGEELSNGNMVWVVEPVIELIYRGDISCDGVLKYDSTTGGYIKGESTVFDGNTQQYYYITPFQVMWALAQSQPYENLRAILNAYHLMGVGSGAYFGEGKDLTTANTSTDGRMLNRTFISSSDENLVKISYRGANGGSLAADAGASISGQATTYSIALGDVLSSGLSSEEEDKWKYYLNVGQIGFAMFKAGEYDMLGVFATFIPYMEKTLGELPEGQELTAKWLCENDEVAERNGGWCYLSLGDFEVETPVSVREYRVVAGLSDLGTGAIKTTSDNDYNLYYDGAKTIIDPIFRKAAADGIDYYKPTKDTITKAATTTVGGKNTGLYINESIVNSLDLDTWEVTAANGNLAEFTGTDNKQNGTEPSIKLDDTVTYVFNRVETDGILTKDIIAAAEEALKEIKEMKDSLWGDDEGIIYSQEGNLTTFISEHKNDRVKETADGRNMQDIAICSTGMSLNGETNNKTTMFNNGAEVLPYVKASYYENGALFSKGNGTRGGQGQSTNPYQPYRLTIPGVQPIGVGVADEKYKGITEFILRGYDVIAHYYDTNGVEITDKKTHWKIEDIGNTVVKTADDDGYGEINLYSMGTSGKSIETLINAGADESVGAIQIDVRAIYTYDYKNEPKEPESEGYIINLELPEYMLHDEYENVDIEHNYVKGDVTVGTNTDNKGKTFDASTWTGTSRGHGITYFYTESLYRPTTAVKAFNTSEEASSGSSYSGTMTSDALACANKLVFSYLLSCVNEDVLIDLLVETYEKNQNKYGYSLTDHPTYYKKITKRELYSAFEKYVSDVCDKDATDVIYKTDYPINGTGDYDYSSKFDINDLYITLGYWSYSGEAHTTGYESYYNGLMFINTNDDKQKENNNGEVIRYWDTSDKTYTVKYTVNGVENTITNEKVDTTTETVTKISLEKVLDQICKDNSKYFDTSKISVNAEVIVQQIIRVLRTQYSYGGHPNEPSAEEKRELAWESILSSLYNDLSTQTSINLTEISLAMPRKDSKYVVTSDLGDKRYTDYNSDRIDEDAKEKVKEVIEDLIEKDFVSEDITEDDYSYKTEYTWNKLGTLTSKIQIYIFINNPFYSLTQHVVLKDEEVFKDNSKYWDIYEYVEEYAEKVIRNGVLKDGKASPVRSSDDLFEFGIKLVEKAPDSTITKTEVTGKTYMSGMSGAKVEFTKAKPTYSFGSTQQKLAMTNLSDFRGKYDEKKDPTSGTIPPTFDALTGALPTKATTTSESDTTGEKTATSIIVRLDRKDIYTDFTTPYTFYTSTMNLGNTDTTSAVTSKYNVQATKSKSVGKQISSSDRFRNKMFYLCYLIEMDSTNKDKIEVPVAVDWVVMANNIGNAYDSVRGGAVLSTNVDDTKVLYSIDSSSSPDKSAEAYLHNYANSTDAAEKLAYYTTPATLPIGIKLGSYWSSQSKSYKVKTPIIRKNTENITNSGSTGVGTEATEADVVKQVYSGGALPVVPEIAMGIGTYSENERNINYSVMQWGTQQRTLEGMVYHTIKFNLKSNVKIITNAVAHDNRAIALRGRLAGSGSTVPVLYSGSEITAVVTPKNSKITAETYMLDYIDDWTTKGYAGKPSWATYNAANVHGDWLKQFVDKVLVTVEQEVNTGVGYETQISNQYVDKFNVTMELGLQIGNTYLPTSCKQNLELTDKSETTDYANIIIGMAKNAAGDYVPTILNLNKEVKYQGITYPNLTVGGYKDAIDAMQLEEMVATAFEVGTGTKLGYIVKNGTGEEIEAIEVDPYVARSAQEYAKANSAIGATVGEGWYIEIVRTLRIKKITTSWDLTQSMIVTDKIPISAGPKSPKNKDDLFTNGYKCAVYAKIKAANLPTKTIRGINSALDFILSDATVNDMKFGA